MLYPVTKIHTRYRYFKKSLTKYNNNFIKPANSRIKPGIILITPSRSATHYQAHVAMDAACIGMYVCYSLDLVEALFMRF